jgi:hypothetical protein
MILENREWFLLSGINNHNRFGNTGTPNDAAATAHHTQSPAWWSTVEPIVHLIFFPVKSDEMIFDFFNGI